MPEGSTSGPAGQQANRAAKGKNKERERSSREESEGDSKDNLVGNGAGVGNASEGKGGSGINRVNSESMGCACGSRDKLEYQRDEQSLTTFHQLFSVAGACVSSRTVVRPAHVLILP